MTKTKRFEMTYLLSLSHFPEQFYPMVMNLSGREALYNNPGTSLRSFVLAGQNSLQEYLDVSASVLATIEECEYFCHSVKVVEDVTAAMMQQPFEIVERISKITTDQKPVATMMKHLKILTTSLEGFWEALKSNSYHGGEIFYYDLFTPEGKRFKQALFDLKIYSLQLVDILEKLQKESA
jgi:hypothetical protein